jgi:hypothetical protein
MARAGVLRDPRSAATPAGSTSLRVLLPFLNEQTDGMQIWLFLRPSEFSWLLNSIFGPARKIIDQ